MNIASKLLSTGLVASLGLLAACDDNIVFNARIAPRVSFDLQSNSGRVALTANQAQTWKATYDTGGKKITFLAGGEKVVFKNVKFDRNRGTVSAEPSRTGQRTSRGDKVGISVDFEKVCNPNCERVERFESTVDCTVMTSPGSCTTLPGGGVYCPPTPSYPGTQRVRVTRTSIDYTADGYMITENSDVLAALSGKYTSVEEKYEPISECR